MLFVPAHPLGIVTAKQLDKLEFGGVPPLSMRYKQLRKMGMNARPVASSRSAYRIRQIGICLTVGLGLHFLYIFDNFRIFQLKLFCVCNYRHNNNLNGSNYIEGGNDIGVVKWIDNRSANKEVAQ